MSVQEQGNRNRKRDQEKDSKSDLQEQEERLSKLVEKCKKLEKEKFLLVEKCRELQIDAARASEQYKKNIKVDTDKAIGTLIKQLLPTFDNLNRARYYKQITGVLESIVSSFEDTFKKQGLIVFGKVGDKFDPNFYEAVSFKEKKEKDEDDKKDENVESTEKTGSNIQVCSEILEHGYIYRGILLRSAKVVVEIK